MSAKATTAKSARKRTASTQASSPVTLAIDIGGTGLKAMLLDPKGKPLSERERIPTPDPATPQDVLDALDELQGRLPGYDRVSVGFPGVTKHGITYLAVNLHPEWANFHLKDEIEKRWKKPARVANDAAVQGYGAIKGDGVELVITLGTGVGSSLFTDGRLCPGLELGHHPWRKKTYEDYLGKRGLKKHGKKRWNKRVRKIIKILETVVNYDMLYIGGGNARLIESPLPDNVKTVSNQDGITGGVKVWDKRMDQTFTEASSAFVTVA